MYTYMYVYSYIFIHVYMIYVYICANVMLHVHSMQHHYDMLVMTCCMCTVCNNQHRSNARKDALVEGTGKQDEYAFVHTYICKRTLGAPKIYGMYTVYDN